MTLTPDRFLKCHFISINLCIPLTMIKVFFIYHIPNIWPVVKKANIK